MNGVVNFQPFENTEGSQKLLERCVERINNEFSNVDARYEIRENRDVAVLASKHCTITVESTGESETSGNSPEATTDSNDADWRAMINDDKLEGSRVESSTTASDDEIEQQESGVTKEGTTRLHVWITGYVEQDKEVITELMNENGVPVQYSHEPSDDGIEFQSHGFGYTNNLSTVEEIKEKFESEFPSKDVSLTDGVLGEHVAIDFFECIRIEPPVESADSNHSTQKQGVDETGEDTKQQETNEAIDNMTTCFECGGNNVVYDDSAEESVCSDCGFVIMETMTIQFENSRGETERTTVENVTQTKTRGKGDYRELWVYVEGELDTIYKDGTVVSERESDASESTPEATDDLDDEDKLSINLGDGETGLETDVEWRDPEEHSELRNKTAVESGNKSASGTADEWRMWYPCPECQSTALYQIAEQHLSVSATEDGSYGGDAGGMEEYDYIECGDCGEVLLDEIGRD